MLLDVKSYGIAFGTRVILADINFSIDMEKGIVVIMGPGGTGKSTLLRSIAGINKRSSTANSWGNILYQDHPIDNNAPLLIQQNAKAMAQPVIECLTEAVRKVSDTLRTIPEIRDYIIEEIEKLKIQSIIPYLDQPMIQLPIEYARAANILQATFSKQPLLLLDEPTTKMTEKGATLLLELIKNISKDRVCITILHNQKQAQQIADKVILLAGGRIQAYENKDDFFSNKKQNDIVAQFLRSGSCYIPAPDADVDALDENAIKPPPLPKEAIEIITKLKEKQQNTSQTAFQTEKALSQTPKPLDAHKNEEADPILMSEADSATAHLARKPTSRSRFVGPNGFHWIVPEKLAGCPMPGIVAPLEYDLSALRDVGITTLVNLTERILPEQTLKQYGIKSIQFKIEDRRAPPIMWIKMLLVQIDKLLEDGEVLGIHCLAGLGRTGTILGAWLIKKGLTAEEALKRLRLIDAGYVQSKEQEDLLYSLENNILIRATNY